MDFITKATTSIMPVLQHPFFKKGCYITAIITILFLGYFFVRNRRKNREALKKKEIIAESHPWTAAISIVFFLSLSFGILADITDWNKPGQITVLDNGNVITKPKVYMAVGAKPEAVYNQTQMITPPEAQGKEEKVKMEFGDYGSAESGYRFRLNLPDNPEQIRHIHRVYGSQEKLVSAGVKPFVVEAMKIGAILLKTDECSTDKEEKLLKLVKDQLAKGLYVVEAGKIRTDESGKALRKKAPIMEYHVQLSNFRLKNFEYEELLKKLTRERKKIIRVLEDMDGITISGLPSLENIQKEIQKQIENSKELSGDQKKLISESIDSFKKIIITLKDKNKKKDKAGEKKED